MKQDFWQQQTDEPLFPKLLWSRPETKLGAGKLLLIGGQAQEFSNVADAFTAAEKAGAGVVRVLLPESTRKFTKFLPNIEYAPANVSGSFSAAALAELLDAASWADGVLLAGNLGKNSETSLMLEKFQTTYRGLLIVSDDACGSLAVPATELFSRPDTVLICSFKSAQKYISELGLQKPLTSSLTSEQVSETFHELSKSYPATVVIQAANFVWAAEGGKVSSTRKSEHPDDSILSANTSVWAIQNPGKLFDAATTAAFC